MLIDKLHIDPDFIRALPNHITITGEADSYKGTLANLLARELATREGLTHVLGYHPLAGLPLETDPEDTAVIFDAGGLRPDDVYFDPFKYAVGVVTLQALRFDTPTLQGTACPDKAIVGELIHISEVNRVGNFDRTGNDVTIQLDLVCGGVGTYSTTVSFTEHLLQPSVLAPKHLHLQQVLDEAYASERRMDFIALLLEGINTTLHYKEDRRASLFLDHRGLKIDIRRPVKTNFKSSISMLFQYENGDIKVYVERNKFGSSHEVIMVPNPDPAVIEGHLDKLGETNISYMLVNEIY